MELKFQHKLIKQSNFTKTKKYTMKKLLLSSVIMLGVCGIAAAQTDSKANKQAQVAASTAAAPTPQKAAIMPASDDVAVPATKTSADKQAAADAAAVPPSPVTKKSKTDKAAATAPATTVNAAGVVVPAAKQN